MMFTSTSQRRTQRQAQRQTQRPTNTGLLDPRWRLEPLVLPAKPGEQLHHLANVLVSTNDHTSQRVPGERFHHLFDQRCKAFGRRQARKQIAVDYGPVSFSYAALAQQSNRLARFLSQFGIEAGDRVGLLMDRSIASHTVVLALSRLGATYVPLDAGFPDHRIAHILSDSETSKVVTLTRFTDRFSESNLPVIAIDQFSELIQLLSDETFIPSITGESDPVAYIIYTSGTTGRPKGVPVRHSSICNFVRVASEVYGYSEGDRVYQGMTIAFDFSVEELWVPLLVGATLVPAPTDQQLVGEDLHDFLRDNHVTALCCVPTLLATIEADLDELTFLLVSGEACPADVIDPWLTPNRRVLNAYGPTETTVTATWSVMEPGQAVTIGGPLPTYSVLILEPGQERPLNAGEVGEICVAGIGLADGYLNRPEETSKAFIDDFIDLPNNPSGQIYRTGDLGRITGENRIEFLGRIDTQVKIRGYRIELDEIAAVMREIEAVSAAVVDTFNPQDSGTELVAYLTPAIPGEHLDITKINQVLRDRLPAYMVPSFYLQLDVLPLLPSTKVDRSALPEPTGARFVSSTQSLVPPKNKLEAQLADLLASLLGLDQVSVTADFFDDLGTDSLKLAEFATAIRSELGIRRVSMKRLYQNPSISQIAESIEPAAQISSRPNDAISPSGASINGKSASAASAALVSSNKALGSSLTPTPRPSSDVSRHSPSDAAYFLTGVAQTLAFLTATFAVALATVAGYRFINAGDGLVSIYFRSVITGAILFFGGSAALVAVKWLAIGRFTTNPIRLWSLRYVRFWIAKRAIQINPMNLLVGSPAYNVFLRSLGMTIGKDSLILARAPICVDLISIGSRSIIREDCYFPGYTASGGYLYPGTIDIGSDAVVAEATVLDISTSVGDRAQLGTSSALLQGMSVPEGWIYQGSPAVPSSSNFDRLPKVPVRNGLRLWYTIGQLLTLTLLTTPSSFLVAFVLAKLGIGTASLAPWSGVFGRLLGLATIAGVLYFGGLLVTQMVVTVVPRLLNIFVVPNKPHPLFGFQYRLARSIQAYSNNILLNTVFGDSSMILGYLRVVGYDLSRSTQTGSNFGVDQRHHSPFLCSFDRNTLVSDGLRILNMEVSASSFQLNHVAMPADTYLGNLVHFPADAKVGANCLIATKAAVPIDGETRSGVGLLGSPVFEIPRSVARDQQFDHYKAPGIIEDRLRLKLRSNLLTLGLYLLRSWALTLWSLAFALGSFAILDPKGTNNLFAAGAAITLATALSVAFTPIFSIVVERLVRRFRPLEPLYCSLYDPRFWQHERFWKLNYNALLRVFDGTPMKPALLRLQGATIGAKAFDDGSGLTEPSLVTIGDNAMLNFQSAIQCHSLEDGTFKSDRVVLGDHCTLGVGAFVHYGSHLGDGSTLEADSFLMKGSTLEEQSRWLGNPARHTESPAESDSKLPNSTQQVLPPKQLHQGVSQ